MGQEIKGNDGKGRQKEILWKVLRYIRKYWFFLALSIILAAVSVAITLYSPILTGDAVDLIIDQGRVDFAGITSILIRIAVSMGIAAAAQWIMNVCNNKMTYQIIRDVRNEASKLEILPLKYIDRHSYGEVVSRVIADVDQFADGFSWDSHSFSQESSRFWERFYLCFLWM